MRITKYIVKCVREFFRQKKKPRVCSAVVVAAGNSTRMGEDKITKVLGGLPVLVRTLQAFESCDAIDEIVVVTRPDRIEEIAELCKRYEVSKVSKVVSGGATRVESSMAGAMAVREDATLIAIHDGARPFVSAELIKRTVEAAHVYSAAAPVLKSTDTLKALDERGNVVGTVDRETTARIQTPQIFDADLIKGALSKAVREKLSLTDDCSAVEALGVRVFAVEGEEDNIKLTTPRDFIIAETIISRRKRECGSDTVMMYTSLSTDEN